MSKLRITSNVRATWALANGRVRPEGVLELNYVALPPEEAVLEDCRARRVRRLRVQPRRHVDSSLEGG